ncbi:MAG: hypothetical protein AB7S80_17205 [Rhizobiaceae bacterium]
MQGVVSGGDAADGGEDAVDTVAREMRRGLVQDEDAGPVGRQPLQPAQDGEHGPVDFVEIERSLLGRRVDAEGRQRRAGCLMLAPPVDAPAGLRPETTDAQVFKHAGLAHRRADDCVSWRFADDAIADGATDPLSRGTNRVLNRMRC